MVVASRSKALAVTPTVVPITTFSLTLFSVASISVGTVTSNSSRSLIAIVKAWSVNEPSAEVARTVIERFDVRTPSPDPLAAQLSGGNLQKYVVGREIERKPQLMIVDQPSWGVDAGAAAAIRQALMDLARSGSAVLAISQDLDELLEISDRLCVMFMGRLSAPMPTALATREALGLLMGGEGLAARCA